MRAENATLKVQSMEQQEGQQMGGPLEVSSVIFLTAMHLPCWTCSTLGIL